MCASQRIFGRSLSTLSNNRGGSWLSSLNKWRLSFLVANAAYVRSQERIRNLNTVFNEPLLDFSESMSSA
jgi:hypothetical protein